MSYAQIESEVCGLMGWDEENLDLVQVKSMRRAVTTALREVWVSEYWRPITLTERRRFRAAWSEDEYAAGTELYHIASDDYYVALDLTSTEPATKVGGEWATNAKWAKLRTCTTTIAWDAATQYATGDQRYDEATGTVYQSHATPTLGLRPSQTPTQWGLVPLFLPAVGLQQAGEVAMYRVDQATWDDPRVFPGTPPINTRRGRLGLEFFDLRVKQPWVRFLTRPHRFTGELYDPSLSYAAAKLDELTGEAKLPVFTQAPNEYVIAESILELLAARVGHAVMFAYVKFDTEPGTAGDWAYDPDESQADNGANIRRPISIGAGFPGRWLKV